VEQGGLVVAVTEAMLPREQTVQLTLGVHSRDNDLIVNPIKGKQLTNVRASGTDEAVRLVPPIQLTLESAVEFIEDDELVEITPKSIRIRKRFLLEHERKRASKE
jgi:GTP-binding protein